MLITIKAVIEGFVHATKEEIARRLSERRRFSAALAFNKLHTYTSFHAGRWMCPACNRVHTRIGYSAFGGLLFPACCHFLEGSRTDKCHATGLPR